MSEGEEETDKPRRGRKASEASRDGLPAKVTSISAKQREAGLANLEKGAQAQRERGEVPRDPNYESRRDQFVAGTLKVEDLDIEELERLQFRDRHGRFTGRPPALTTAQSRALHSEWRKRVAALFEASTTEAIKAIMKVMASPGAKDSDRLRAAELLLARSLGKEIQPTVVLPAQWEDFLEDTVVVIDRSDVG